MPKTKPLHLSKKSAKPLRDDLMVQEQIKGSSREVRVWKHMVAVIMLNRTNRKIVKQVFPIFDKYWKTPEAFMFACEIDVKEVLKPLGMVNIRYRNLYKMSLGFSPWYYYSATQDATELYGIGKYGSDSFEIFFKKNYNVVPTDKELIKYLEKINTHQNTWKENERIVD